MTTKPRVTFAPAFQKNIKRLRKKYPHIQQDFAPLIDQLMAGGTPGERVQSTGYVVYKVRLPNRDTQRGKSGGYRVIYYLRTAELIVLLMIYAKSERADVSADEIQGLIADLLDDAP
jgi:mRNA-degrading endonuclease RelE of RelBE toxin-antitoxin system